MRKLRDRRAERVVEQNLLVCVRQMILAANDMRDRHLNVIKHYGKVVERMSVRAQQYKVFDF